MSVDNTWLEEAMQFQQLANSTSSTVLKMASNYSDLAKRCVGLQKKVQNLTDANQELNLKDIQMRQEILRLKDELETLKTPARIESTDQAVQTDSSECTRTRKDVTNGNSPSNNPFCTSMAQPFLFFEAEEKEVASKQEHQDSNIVLDNGSEMEASGQVENVADILTKVSDKAIDQWIRKRKTNSIQSFLDENELTESDLAKKIKRHDCCQAICTVDTTEAIKEFKELADIKKKGPYGEIILKRPIFWYSSNNKTISELRQEGIPLLDIFIKSSCGIFSFPAFPLKVMEKALGSTVEFPLNMQNFEVCKKMQQGEIMFAKKVFSPRTKKLKKNVLGFDSCAKSTWHNYLLEYEKENNNQYRFITLHDRCKAQEQSSQKRWHHGT